MLILYYSLPTGFGGNCNHYQGTFTRILIKYNRSLLYFISILVNLVNVVC